MGQVLSGRQRVEDEQKSVREPGRTAHTFNPDTQEAEVGKSLGDGGHPCL